MIDRELAALEGLGRLEACTHEISTLSDRLAEVPLWSPSHALVKQADEVHRLMDQMKARWDRRLVVTLIGPSGAGKSTLLNALAGVDDLSPTGSRRPTTQKLLVLADDAEEARHLLGPMDTPHLEVHTSRTAAPLAHAILVDTPDTDSTQCDAHLPLIQQAVDHSDVLICVFDAQNPKRRDHADFMAPIVSRFHGASLVAVVNQCDRLGAEELTEEIGPEFQRYLQDAWDTTPEAVLLVSARRHLNDPKWEQQAEPRHDLDQFDRLHRLVFDTFNRAGSGTDRRLANARQLKAYLVKQVGLAVEKNRSDLEAAAGRIAAAEKEALHEAVASLSADDQRMLMGMNARLYQSLAQRWMGPVGWMVAIWSRLLLFGTGLAALVRFGNPLRQLWGLIASWRRYRESREALGSLKDQTRIDRALQTFQKAWWTRWPDIGERLVQGRFDAKVRRLRVEDEEAVGALMSHLWTDTLDAEIERSARSLSHFLLQLLFNLPSLALLGYVGWLTASSFLAGSYLSGDFFLHALLTLAVVLLLSFFLLQICVRVAVGRDRIQRRAFVAVERDIQESPLVAGREVAEQVEKVLGLSVAQNSVEVK